MGTRLAHLGALALLALVVVLPTGAAASGDVPLDMESHVPLLYGQPLSVVNLYWDAEWPQSSREEIDASSKALIDSAYFAATRQYGVPRVLWAGSAVADPSCGARPDDGLTTLAIMAFVACEEALPGVLDGGGFPTPGPFPYGNATATTIYNVVLPAGIHALMVPGIPSTLTCGGELAYHFLAAAHQHYGLLGTRPLYFAVLPFECAGSKVKELMALLSHEDVEVMTDPSPFAHWFDESTAPPLTDLRSIVDALNRLATYGEAADICETFPEFTQMPYRADGILMLVGTYWSNESNACVASAFRVVKATFAIAQPGPPSADVAIEPPGNVLTTTPAGAAQAVLEGTVFSFEPPIAVTTDERWRRSFDLSSECGGLVLFPAGDPGTATAQTTKTCRYVHQYRVRFTVAGLPEGTPSGVTAPRHRPADGHRDVRRGASDLPRRRARRRSGRVLAPRRDDRVDPIRRNRQPPGRHLCEWRGARPSRRRRRRRGHRRELRRSRRLRVCRELAGARHHRAGVERRALGEGRPAATVRDASEQERFLRHDRLLDLCRQHGTVALLDRRTVPLHRRLPVHVGQPVAPHCRRLRRRGASALRRQGRGGRDARFRADRRLLLTGASARAVQWRRLPVRRLARRGRGLRPRAQRRPDPPPLQPGDLRLDLRLRQRAGAGGHCGRRDRLRLCFGRERRQPLEPPRQVPVPLAEQLHRGRQEHGAHDRRVDEHRDREAEPHLLHRDLAHRGEEREDADHDERGARDRSRRAGDRVRDRFLRPLTRVDAFLDAAEDEHVVVHRQAEQDHEQEQRQPGSNREGAREAEDALCPPVLEHDDEQTVRGTDGKQVQDDRLERDHDRAEREQHQKERQPEDEREHDRQTVLHLLVEVVGPGRDARDGPLRVGDRRRDRRNDLVAQRRERVVRDFVVALARDRELHPRNGLVRVHEDVERREELACRERIAPEGAVRLDVRRPRHVAAAHDELDGRLRARERALHVLERLDDRNSLRQVGQAGQLRVQRQHGQPGRDEQRHRRHDRYDRPAEDDAHDGAPEAVLAAVPAEVREAALVDAVAE